MNHAKQYACFVVPTLLMLGGAADTAPLPAGVYTPPGSCFGQVYQYTIRDNESLIEIARQHGLGFNEIMAANPGIDPFMPPSGATVILPSGRLLPQVSTGTGIVVNIPEMRLYYFPEQATEPVLSFPVGIGDNGRETPLGSFVVTAKIADPSWYVPRSIRRNRPDLPTVLPPGPDNPMGSHALRLSRKSILIHGTNRPFSIGRKASHGCIRLYSDDMLRLFNLVKPGTVVAIVNQPVKSARWEGRTYIEVHDRTPLVRPEEARNMLKAGGLYHDIDDLRLLKAVYEARGMPVAVSRTGGVQNGCTQ